MRAIVMAAVCVAGAGCNGERLPTPAEPKAPPAKKVVVAEFQGRWKLVARERAGRALHVSDNRAARGLKFDGDKLYEIDTSAGKETDTLMTVSAHDPAATPKQFDLTVGPGRQHAGEVVRCIYDLTGDRFVLMMADNGKSRPATLDSAQVVGVEKQTFERMK